MDRNKLCKHNAERGISITGLILVLGVLGVVGIFAMRLIPAYVEYNAVQKAVAQAKASGGTVREMQAAFDRHAGINNVEAISGRDLVITRDTGTPEISFDYEKRLPLAGNVSLVIDFAGTTDPSGTVAAADDAQAAR
jgi:type II secretory pathway pseudopilin PulG